MRTLKIINTQLVKEITVIDPDTKGEVQLSVYKHSNGAMFAIDSSYIDQVLDEDEETGLSLIPDPFDIEGKDRVLI